jgi:hypothetical protein
MARYTIRARNGAGMVDFQERLTIEAALNKVESLRDAHFEHITLINQSTGLEISDLEALIQAQRDEIWPPQRST